MVSGGKTGRRSPAFIVSLLLHCTMLFLMARVPRHAAQPSETGRMHAYSVQLLRFNLPRYTARIPATGRRAAGSQAAASRRNAVRRAAGQDSDMSAAASAGAAGAPAHREFTMPDLAIVRPARQTIIRPDVPPTIPLKQSVPLPNMLLAAAEKPPPFPSRRFVTPSVQRIKAKSAAVSLAPAPEIQAQAEIPSGMRIAASITDLAHLPVPAGPPTPLRHYSVRQVRAAAAPYQGGAPPSVSLLSITDNPVLPAEVVAVPVANQAAPGTALQADSGHSSGSGNGAGSGAGEKAGTAEGAGSGDGGLNSGGTGGSSSDGASSGGKGSGTLSASNRGSGSGGGAGANAAGGGSNKSGSREAGSGAGGSAYGGPAGDGGAGGALNAGLPGTTALTLPKDGKFGVVVLGSTPAAPYPESSGTLSGKVVYTVYLRVGQRKNWILQYCLPRSAASRSRVEGTRTPLEAPWPYNIVRLNHAPDSDYLLVHGMVTVEGRFDQLAMVFPQELDGKDLLLQSLNRWAFRPASRDGEPTPVEVLLIIPREE